jgi:hypothetical protein
MGILHSVSGKTVSRRNGLPKSGNCLIQALKPMARTEGLLRSPRVGEIVSFNYLAKRNYGSTTFSNLDSQTHCVILHFLLKKKKVAWADMKKKR